MAKYRDLVKDAIVSLKERNGSSRGAIKKHILANNNLVEPARAGGLINQAIRIGVEKGVFIQPKGPSGTVKLAKASTSTKPKASAAKPASKSSKKVAAPAKKASAEKPLAKAAPTKKAASAKAPSRGTKAASKPTVKKAAAKATTAKSSKARK